MVATRRTVLQSVGIVGGTLALGGLGTVVVRADYHESTEEEAAAGMTELRVIHASPDAPDVDVLVDGDLVLSNVPFGTVSEYLALETGEHDVEITKAGEPDTVVFSETIDLAEGKFTIMALGEIGAATFQPQAFEDMATAPMEDEVAIRLIHASPDAPEVDVVLVALKEEITPDDIQVVEQLSFGSASEYLTSQPGPHAIEVYPAIDPESPPEAPPEPVATAEVDLQGGKAYSGIALGYLEAEGDQPMLELQLVTDATLDDQAAEDEEPIEEEEEEFPVEEDEEILCPTDEPAPPIEVDWIKSEGAFDPCTSCFGQRARQPVPRGYFPVRQRPFTFRPTWGLRRRYY
ncbi:DUF4397 domain-containing protein [Haloarchaeobius amylolyticus]|uniref:DUF4397 domain-containing protein n=1 Tax=Haloarchaeobius amylolyticus TaxID=1198296 RepID=UPI00226D4EAA|nr:DUF4397 domain-containing protein [Haloarchaeobius amylolyticus]